MAVHHGILSQHDCAGPTFALCLLRNCVTSQQVLDNGRIKAYGHEQVSLTSDGGGGGGGGDTGSVSFTRAEWTHTLTQQHCRGNTMALRLRSWDSSPFRVHHSHVEDNSISTLAEQFAVGPPGRTAGVKRSAITLELDLQVCVSVVRSGLMLPEHT